MNPKTEIILRLVDDLDAVCRGCAGKTYAVVQREIRAATQQALGERDAGEATPDDDFRTLAQSDILVGICNAYFEGVE